MRFGFLILGIISLCVRANVTIQYTGNELRYEQNPRIETVLSGLVLRSDFYWPNSALFKTNAPAEQKLKRDILGELRQLKNNTGVNSEKWKALDNLEAQIISWKVAHRLAIPIDYDLARIREDYNPRLDDGEYALYLPFRPNTISVFGMVEEEKEIQHLSATGVGGYLSSFTRRDYADNEFLYVIYPNGKSIKISTSAYEIRHIEVPPGGSIYVPMKELPFLAINENLNDKIALLAGSRIP